MSLRCDIKLILQSRDVPFDIWGYCGEKICYEISQKLGVAFWGIQMAFIVEVGNLRVDPLSLEITGDNEKGIGAVFAAMNLRNRFPDTPLSWVQLMEHAGEIYILKTETGMIAAFDALRVFEGEETLTWPTLIDFITWMSDTARSIHEDPHFRF